MKTRFLPRIIVCLLCAPLLTHAATFYVDSSASGSDSNNGTIGTPWKTIAKVNSISLQPGDSVLFKRGQTFFGTLIPLTNGAVGNPITFGAYESGAPPILTGAVTLSNWQSVPGSPGVYEADLNAGSDLNMVVLDGAPQRMGRWPNSTASNGGYLNFDSHTNNDSPAPSITDSDFNPPFNVVGAEVVIRLKEWVMNRNPITSINNKTIFFTPPNNYEYADGYGYFIQNHPATLDELGEWYYDPGAHKLRMYFGANPPSNYAVQAAVLEKIVDLKYKSNFVVENLTIRGSKTANIYFEYSGTNAVSNCTIEWGGRIGSLGNHGGPTTITNCKYENHLAIAHAGRYGSHYLTLTGCTFNNTALIPGGSDSGQESGPAVMSDNSDNIVITNNTVTNSGGGGIVFNGTHILVQNNYLKDNLLVFSDYGGIYTWGGRNKPDRRIIGNIVINCMGGLYGTDHPNYAGGVGIYLDDTTNNVEISDNTVDGASRAGIFLHNNGVGIVIKNNKVRNAPDMLNVTDDVLGEEDISTGDPADRLRGLIMTGNVMAAADANQSMYGLSVYQSNDISQWGGDIDDNYFIRPGGFANAFNTYGPGAGPSYSLTGWKSAYSPYDQNSVGIVPTDTVILVYNETTSPKSIPLDSKYQTHDGIPHNGGSITLQPFESAILQRTGPLDASSLVYVSDLNWTGTPVNGWGPPEKDHTNGDLGAADGTPIILRGSTYSKGIGAHAYSEITYALNGQYGRFLSDVGIDDDANGEGSVIFQVWADGVKIYDSGILTGTSPVKSFNINVSGKNEMKLIVLDTGDNNYNDHSDWAGARLIKASAQPPATFSLWRLNYFDQAGLNDVATSGASADPDKDGIANLLEYYFNRDPWAPEGAAGLPVLQIIGSDLTLTYQKDTAKTDALAVVEKTTNIAAFTGIADTLLGTVGTVQTRRAAEPVQTATGSRQFLRLKVSASPFTGSDIGAVGVPGSYSFDGTTHTIQASGGDIWNAADQFHFASSSVSGDQTIVAKITSLTNSDQWAKAGVMFRNSSADNSQFAYMSATAEHGVAFQWRAATGGQCDLAQAASAPIPTAVNPVWVKLVKTGSSFTGFYSTNGITWIPVGSAQAISFSNSSYLAGLAVTSHNNAVLTMATFTDVAVSP